MLVALAILLVLAILVWPRILVFRDRHTTRLGSMSERWVADYRATH